MKRKRFCLAAVLVMLLALPTLVAAQYPALRARVNDYAGKLTPNQEQQLETRLANFERATSIQIAIAVVTTLNGQSENEYATRLFNAWQLGQRGENNGLLVLWAPNQRRWRLEVGYGLERFIADSAAAEIGRNRLVPRLWEDRGYEGLRDTVESIIERLDDTPWTVRLENSRLQAERAQAAAQAAAVVAQEQAKRKAENDLRQAEIDRVENERQAIANRARNRQIMIGLGYVAGATLLLGLTFAWYKWQKEKSRKIRLLIDILSQIANRSSEAQLLIDGLPETMNYALQQLQLERDKEKARQLQAEAMAAHNQLQTAISSWDNQVTTDPDAVHKEMASFNFQRTSNILARIQGLVGSYNQALVDAPIRISETESEVYWAEQAMNALEAQGFRFEHASTFRTVRDETLQQARAKLNEQPADPVRAMEICEDAIKATVGVVENGHALLQKRTTTEQGLGRLRNRIQALRIAQAGSEVRDMAEWLKGQTDRSLWAQTMDHVNGIPNRIREFDRLLNRASTTNDMDHQHFDEAARQATALDAAIAEAENDLAQLRQIHTAQSKAKAGIKKLLDQTILQFGAADDTVSDSDVDEPTQRDFRAAAAKLAQVAQRHSQKNNMDWAGLAADISAISQEGGNAISRAQRQIEDAEERRRRAKRRAAEAAAAARRSSSTSPSGSSFRGGGGRSGGGGAGGSY